jgi:hypothetical protein
MATKQVVRRLIVGLAAAGVAAGAWAQLPAVKSAGDVRYLSGGVGDDEELEIRRAAAEFGVLLEFAEVERGNNHGKWSADIDVIVRSGNLAVLSTRADGPLLLMRLAPGAYTVEAARKGVRQTKRIEVKPGKLTRERYFWIVDAPLQ